MKLKFFKSAEQSFEEILHTIRRVAQQQPISLGKLIQLLSKKGLAILLILFSVPFCFPITIPGLSTPFGILFVILGWQYMFAAQLWVPNFLKEKKIPADILGKILNFAEKVLKKLKRVIHPRLKFILENVFFRVLNGLVMIVCGFLLSLPIPVPFTNTLAALPLLCLGIGLLENDGALILIAYILACLSLIYFAAIAWLGHQGIEKIFYFWQA